MVFRVVKETSITEKMSNLIEGAKPSTESTLSLQNLDLEQATSLSEILGLSPTDSPTEENHPVKTLQVSIFIKTMKIRLKLMRDVIDIYGF